MQPVKTRFKFFLRLKNTCLDLEKYSNLRQISRQFQKPEIGLMILIESKKTNSSCQWLTLGGQENGPSQFGQNKDLLFKAIEMGNVV